MIARLKGTVTKTSVGSVILETHGVGYDVSIPPHLWDELSDETEATLYISTYVREDRFELFGMASQQDKTLFEKFIGISGIGPKTGLELLSVPRSILLQAVSTEDPKLLSSVKGIGKKTAEKILIELKSLFENTPVLVEESQGLGASGEIDTDAIDALKTLGYDTPSILQVLKDLPEDLGTTEERVTAALRAL